MMKFDVERIENLITEEELPKVILSFGMERKKEILNKKNKNKRLESAAATILMNQLLVDLNYDSDALEKDVRGKVRFKNHKDLSCSISHSKELVACAISEKAIGIDIQKMEKKNHTLLSNRFFTQQEKIYLKQNENQIEIFYKIWTGKESYLKMLGIGLQKELNSFQVDLIKSAIFDLKGNQLANLFYKEYEGYILCICMQEFKIWY